VHVRWGLSRNHQGNRLTSAHTRVPQGERAIEVRIDADGLICRARSANGAPTNVRKGEKWDRRGEKISRRPSLRIFLSPPTGAPIVGTIVRLSFELACAKKRSDLRDGPERKNAPKD